MVQRILVAEDEPIVAFDLCDTVEEAGYEVEGPFSGVSSAALASEKEKPDLAILDITLEDGEVFSLAKRLEADNVPIIFHSGAHSRDEVAEQFPAATTLIKPCPPAEMLSAVNTALERTEEEDTHLARATINV
ncbi:MAG: response regulator [Erythrobacter sp.]|uniref:response regulator n=1 Tax=Erythrobacter sp. TaxID=1042 RepID=UPI002619006B|nr:response regulator [Erythrobacter sp.]MDJ0978715.1 response regulator [Erythrobacter sp.]